MHFKSAMAPEKHKLNCDFDLNRNVEHSLKFPNIQLAFLPFLPVNEE
jgi:hypothetical protein